jgi:virulence factor Mce-like protein
LRWKRRAQGVGFLVVVALLLGLTIGIYNKALPWQATDTVTLQAARIGDQLVVPADVKLRGVLVGRVSAATSKGFDGGANPVGSTLTLQISKSQMKNIPSNVQAMILPKTLFGEKYVDLEPPSRPSTTTFADMETKHQPIVITQDDSSTAVEIQTVFSHLVPLLKTLNPAQLSITLNALATALENRGNELGQNLSLTDQYFTTFNTDQPNELHDISGLADLASNYADATPNLLAILRNSTVTAKTFTVKKDTYAQFLAGTAGFAMEGTKVIGDNANGLIDLARISEPVLNLYSKYSITLECLANGLAIYDRTRLESAFDVGPYLHITLTPVGDRGAYSSNDQGVNDKPSAADNTALAPNCHGLPYGSHPLHPTLTRYPSQARVSDHYNQGGVTGPPTQLPGVSAPGNTMGVGSAKERNQIRSLLKSLTGDVTAATGANASLSDLLVGPMVRGMAVSPA